MGDNVAIRRETLGRVMRLVQALGTGQHLDDVLDLIAHAVVDVIGFDAVAVNVRTHSGDLAVRTVVGPPEMEQLLGGTLSHDGWLELLASGAGWGELRFLREPDLDDEVPHLDPWQERLPLAAELCTDPAVESWQPEFALLAPMWRAPGDLLGVISVDLPRSGLTPDAEQRALLELFASQAAAAVERVHAFDAASDAASLYRAAFGASPAPTTLLDDALRVVEANPAFLELSDALSGELDGRPLADIIRIDEFDSAAAQLARLPVGRSTVIAEECRLNHPRGQKWDKWVHVAVQRVDSVSADDRYVCIVSDRTAARAALSAMRRVAEYDGLTGLQVRDVGLREIERRAALLSHGRRAVMAFLYCDLDNFKIVNDTSGHVVGDEILAAVAARLRQVADPDDSVCRWGGDEFGVIAERRSIAELVDLAHRLVTGVRVLADTATSHSPVSRLGLSVGVAPFTEMVDTIAVMEAADVALYRSKNHPVDKVHVEPV